MPAVKVVERTDDFVIVEGLGVPYRGPDNGRDLHGEYFSEKTEFLLGDYSDRPLRYQHGHDSTIEYAKIGTVKAITPEARGLWVRSQIDMSNEYKDMLDELLGKDALGYSSGAQDSAVKTDWNTGHIDRWPIVEMTLTPRPANPYAMITMAGKSLRRELGEGGQGLGPRPPASAEPGHQGDDRRTRSLALRGLPSRLQPASSLASRRSRHSNS